MPLDRQFCLTTFFKEKTVRTTPCDSTQHQQEWVFQRNRNRNFFPLDKIDDILNVKRRREERMLKRGRGKFIELNDSNMTLENTENNANSKLTENIRALLDVENRQNIEGQVEKHESQLANEIRQLYHKITSLQRNQAMIFVQSNGLLAARALNLETCSRVKGNGKS